MPMEIMRLRFAPFLLNFALALSPPAWGQGPGPPSVSPGAGSSSSLSSVAKVPAGTLLVKGAWPSASDRVTPVPEAGGVTNGVFSNPYFGINYALPPGWTEKYQGPPPSPSGRYVLAQISPGDGFQGPDRGSILITAEDLFFSPTPAVNALELVQKMQTHLQADYQVEIPPGETRIAGRPFAYFAYGSPVAQLHWYVLATQIRCHAVEFVLTSRDLQLLQRLVQGINGMNLPGEASPAGGTGLGAFPACVNDYVRNENLLRRVDPVFAENRFNRVPVRIIIDKEGKVKHIHFLSAFNDQARAITDALGQWRFKPFQQAGKPVELETGILFGPPPNPQAR